MFCLTLPKILLYFMYQILLIAHSYIRWFVLISLITAIYRSYKGYFLNLEFSKTDNSIRHWAATIAHIQLLIGVILYTQSPIIKYFWGNFKETSQYLEFNFFGLIHLILMLIALVVITIGSAMAKRKQGDKEKFKTMLIWFSVGLLLIFIAIPWAFSPLANRPYFR
jgi:hypothetical protein